MQVRKRHIVRIAWLACLAVLLAALAPTLSHMLAGAGRAAELAIEAARCTTRAADADANASMPAMTMPKAALADNAGAMPMNDCGYCTLQADLPMLPHIAGAAPLLEAIVRHVPPLFLVADAPLPIWLAAQSRAPPAR